MRLNKIICATAVACLTMAATAVSAMAAQSFTIGKPIDLTTNKEVETFEAGQYIAFPVKVTSDTGSAYSFQFAAAYDSALTPGIDASVAGNEESAIYDNLDELGAPVQNVADNKYAFMDCDYYIYKKVVKLSNADPILVNTAFSGGTEVMVGMSYNEGTTLKSDTQFYALFTVNSDISGLNKKLLTINGEKSSINTDTKVTKTNPDVTQEKANACAGAFKITIDSTTVPKYVHALYVSFDNGTTKQAIDQYVTSDNKIYDFPVRVKSTKDGSVTAKLYADLGTTADTVSDAGVEIGTVTVDLSGTATDYAVASVTVPKE